MSSNVGVEAMFCEKLGGNVVGCHLCSHHCRIVEGKRGLCGVRENRDGTLYSLVYGKLVSQAVDPIEKKPLFHVIPGSSAYSITTVGCNFRCRNCQNWEISQSPKPIGLITGRGTSPEETAKAANRTGCQSIAYTYTEPTIFMEYAYDTAKLAVENGVRNVFVTNGYITEEALEAYNYKRFRSLGVPYHPKGLGVGYLITVEGRTIYHAGDSDFIPEMKQLNLKKVDLALLPSGGTYTMDNPEAAETKSHIKCVALKPGEQFTFQ